MKFKYQVHLMWQELKQLDNLSLVVGEKWSCSTVKVFYKQNKEAKIYFATKKKELSLQRFIVSLKSCISTVRWVPVVYIIEQR